MTTEPAAALRRPVACLVDLFVFAPLGLAVVARDRLPGLIEAGRRQAEMQVRVARMVGEFAVNFGRHELTRRLASATAPPPDPTVPPSRPTDAVPSGQTGELPADDTTAVARVAPVTALRLPPVGELAIPGYDSLAASQVVGRLASLSPAELAVVRAYETASRHRRTILHRIEELVG